MKTKDLLVILEGPDDEEVMKTVLSRPDDLRIRSIIFEFERRASAVPTQGPDIARERRREFQFVICLWDHTGSEQPARAQGKVQERLNQNPLKDCSKALVINPELEIWLWQDQAAIASALEVDEGRLLEWLNDWPRRQSPNQSVEALIKQFPKEAFEEVCRRAGQKPRAALYGRIASRARLDLWGRELSFRRLQRTLRRWFPPASSLR